MRRIDEATQPFYSRFTTICAATLWRPRPLSWIVTKTFQHTYEHGDTLLRMVLWWKHIAAQIAAHRTAQGHPAA
jgi:hypothetical protein